MFNYNNLNIILLFTLDNLLNKQKLLNIKYFFLLTKKSLPVASCQPVVYMDVSIPLFRIIENFFFL